MRQVIFLLVLIFLMSCKKLISPPAINAPNNYLVVNGSIVSGDSTIINLSRTFNITTGAAQPKPELNATVTIEGSQGQSYALTPKNNGNYVSAALNLSAAQTYRLKITTSNGKQYASDFVPLKNAPPVDSLGYAITANGLQINLNTHDATNSTHYYRWDYAETYQVHSEYNSRLIVIDKDTTRLRTADEEIYNCWVTNLSNDIILGSSAKLSNDVISRQQVALIPSNSEKLMVKYSILVKQYALTSDAYNYYTLLKKNTEQLGSIFDAQPSALTGNIHSLSNPSEPVIGYVTAGAITQSRIFVDNGSLPGGWVAYRPYYNGCYIFRELYDDVDPSTGYDTREVQLYVYPGFETPIDTLNYPGPGLKTSKPYCVDCTLRGTNKQPAFWK